MRRAAFVVALAASWCVLLLWAAGVDWRAPISPDASRRFAAGEFRAVFGTAEPRDGSLHVDSAGEDFSALQSIAVPNVDAAMFPILRYRFGDFPRTLELSLMFRTAEHPDDVQTISLPWPGKGVSTFDLSHVEAWKGTVVELGFAQFATAHNVPPELGFKPFDLRDAQLWSPSWRGALAAAATDWFGAWPWSQRSVHALGREGEASGAQSAVLVAALAALLAIAWAALLLGLRGHRLLAACVASVALAWLALDLRWQSGLVHRLLATRTLYAGLPWGERERIVGDREIVDAADDLRALLRGSPEPARILVAAGSRYQALRLIWHLLPLNVGELVQTKIGSVAIPEGSVIVFFDNDAWHDDAAVRALLARSRRVHAAAALHADGFDEQRLVVFRYRHAR